MNQVLIISGIFSGIVLVTFVFIELYHVLRDMRSVQAVKNYCKREHLIFDKVRSLPSYYALYFLKDGKNYYVPFSCKGSNIYWIDGSPLEKIRKRQTVRSLKVENRNKLRIA